MICCQAVMGRIVFAFDRWIVVGNSVTPIRLLISIRRRGIASRSEEFNGMSEWGGSPGSPEKSRRWSGWLMNFLDGKAGWNFGWFKA